MSTSLSTKTAPPRWGEGLGTNKDIYRADAEKKAADAIERAANGLTGAPWVQRHTKVHQHVLRNHSPEKTEQVAIFRRLVGDRGDVYITPKRLTEIFGYSEKVIREWVTPGTDKANRGGVLAAEVWLRVDPKTGEPDYKHWHENADGTFEERWRLDVRPLHLDPVLDAAGNPVLKADGTPKKTPRTRGDQWAPFHTAWGYEHPKGHAGNQWVKWTKVVTRSVTDDEGKTVEEKETVPAVSAGAKWVTAVMLSEVKTNKGTDRTPDYIAEDWGMKPRQFKTHLAAAEDAGLLTVHGPRFGRTSPLRVPHRIAVPADTRTSEKRVPSCKPQPKPEPVVDNTPVTVEEDPWGEPPF